MRTYSLWDEPWIPIMTTPGASHVLGIRETLAQAHNLRGIFDPSPLVTVAINRLLLAVLLRVFEPRDVDEWAQLWKTGRFPEESLAQYGDPRSAQFDLFHSERPFYQVPLIADEKVHPITALIIEAASGNNPTLFDHGLVRAVTADRAARHLVAHQAFAVGGGISKPFNRKDGPIAKGMVVEARSAGSLFETLMLNLLPLNQWNKFLPSEGEDKPCWEIDVAGEPRQKGTQPLGPLHYLTWQSRQIHLCADDHTGVVTGCQIRQRFCLPEDGERRDPWMPYRRDKEAGWLPFKVDRNRAVWQFTHVLLQQSDHGTTSPRLMDWLAKVRALESELGISVPPVVGLSVSGLTRDPKKAAKIDLWRREQIPLPAAYVDVPDNIGRIKELLGQARRGEALLDRTAVALAWAMGERQKLREAARYVLTGKVPDGGKIPPGFQALGHGLGLRTRYWAALELPFREAFEDLPERGYEMVRDRWKDAVSEAVSEAFRATRDSLLYAEASFEVLTTIEREFRKRLSGLFTDTAEGETPDAETSRETDGEEAYA